MPCFLFTGGVMSELVNTGVIEVLCPDGWLNSPVYDMFAEDKNTLDINKICLLKQAQRPDEYFECPAFRLNYHGKNNRLMEVRSIYTDIEDVDFYVGDIHWVGFTGKYMGYLNGFLRIEGRHDLSVTLCLTNSRCSFSLTDEDFMQIMTSIRVV